LVVGRSWSGERRELEVSRAGAVLSSEKGVSKVQALVANGLRVGGVEGWSSRNRRLMAVVSDVSVGWRCCGSSGLRQRRSPRRRRPWSRLEEKRARVPGFWKARSVEGCGLRRRELWVYRRRRFTMPKVFGLEESRTGKADDPGLEEPRVGARSAESLRVVRGDEALRGGSRSFGTESCRSGSKQTRQRMDWNLALSCGSHGSSKLEVWRLFGVEASKVEVSRGIKGSSESSRA
jgi:hypothetical protein